jgi:hypothetical protein
MKFILKWSARFIGILLIILIIVGVITFLWPKIAESPSVEKAPYGIQTYSVDSMKVPSRVYYASRVEFEGNTAVITGYWSYDGKKYTYHEDKKSFPFAEYGSINIIDRRR